MNHAALAAVHGIEAKGLAGALDFFGGGGGAEAEFFDAQQTVIVGIEQDARVILGGHAQHLHGQVLELEQEFGAVAEQEIDVGAAELHHHIGGFKVVCGGVAIGDDVVQIESRFLQQGIEESINAGAD